MTTQPKGPGGKTLPAAHRRSVQTSTQDWIRTGTLRGGEKIPLLVEPALDGVDPIAWANNNRARVDALLLEHRALLFRDFPIKTVADFEEFVRATSTGEPLAYRDRSTPRENRGQKAYTSTVYPSDQIIRMHNEGTYWITWALKIYFCCLKAPAEGGATPIADVRRVFERLDPAIRETFMRKKMMLVRNYNDGFGLTWQEVFQTQDRAEVEDYCHKNRIEFEWKDGDRLKTRQVRPAVRMHPHTGEPVWFNHVAFFHVTSLEPEVQETLLADFGEEGLPYNTYYGDGTSIEPAVVDEIRAAYVAEQIAFPWQPGDVMLLDNMSVAHGREPFKGEREVVVSMTEPCSDEPD